MTAVTAGRCCRRRRLRSRGGGRHWHQPRGLPAVVGRARHLRCCRLPPQSGAPSVTDRGVNISQCLQSLGAPAAAAAASCRNRHQGKQSPPTVSAAIRIRRSYRRRRPFPPPLIMVDTGLLRSSCLVAEALGTMTIPADLAAILAAHSWTVCKDCSAARRSNA